MFWLLPNSTCRASKSCLFLTVPHSHPSKWISWKWARSLERGTAKGADPNWPKRYYIPCNSMLSNKSWGGRVLLSRQLLLRDWVGPGLLLGSCEWLPSHHLLFVSPPFLHPLNSLYLSSQVLFFFFFLLFLFSPSPAGWGRGEGEMSEQEAVWVLSCWQGSMLGPPLLCTRTPAKFIWKMLEMDI